MVKTFNAINAFFGILVGGGVAIYGIATLFIEPGVEAVGWLFAGIAAVAYGVFQRKKFRQR